MTASLAVKRQASHLRSLRGEEVGRSVELRFCNTCSVSTNTETRFASQVATVIQASNAI